MSSRSKKRKSAEHIYEDEPNKRRSTPGHRDANPDDQTSAAARKKQNTLTQMRWIPSSCADGDVDLEFERSPLEPRTYSRRTTTRRRKPKVFQSETITQMDFLSPTFPDENSVKLEEDTLISTPSAAPGKKKERASRKEEPLARAVQSRSLQRQASAGDEVVPKGDDDAIRRAAVRHDVDHARQLAPNPATPRRQSSNVWRGEVPSSQSPPDSPLSTQSSVRQPSRSPLKERSTNILSPNRPVGKGILFPPSLEVADTLGSDCEDSQTPTQAQPNPKESQHCYMLPGTRMRTDSQMTDVKTPFKGTQCHAAVMQDSGQTTNTNVKSEIQDSDEDEEDEEDDGKIDGHDHELEPPVDRGTGHAAFDFPDESFRRSNPVTTTTNTVGTTAVRDFGLEHADGSTSLEEAVHQEQSRIRSRATSEPSTPDFEEEASQQQLSNGTDDPGFEIDHIPSTPITATAPNPEEASGFSRHSNIDQYPLPLAPETESQFENAWRTLSPPTIRSPDMIPSSQPCSPKALLNTIDPHLKISPFKLHPLPPREPQVPSQATTIGLTPTQPWRRPSPRPRPISPITSPSDTSNNEAANHEVALPSQATTTDITQPQASLAFPVNVDLSSSPQRLSSPPPPPSLPPLSSSPLQARKGKDAYVYTGYAGGWDGKRRTASQLLPDSIMNDSVLGPPGWGTQESLDEETCG